MWHGRQVSADNGVIFTNLSNDTIFQNVHSSQLSVLNANEDLSGFIFRCVLSGCGQSLISDTAHITSKKSANEDFVPNIFTPNSDGKNDFFEVKTEGLTDLNGTVFNRWGQEVFKWKTLTDKWDGKNKSGDLNDGVYFYILSATSECDGKIVERKGSVSVFK